MLVFLSSLFRLLVFDYYQFPGIVIYIFSYIHILIFLCKYVFFSVYIDNYIYSMALTLRHNDLGRLFLLVDSTRGSPDWIVQGNADTLHIVPALKIQLLEVFRGLLKVK